MSVEVEAKIKVASHEGVRATLNELGAARLGCVLETNHIFDNGERTLLAADCGLRVRACRSVEGAAPAATLTYKGPREPGTFKERQEIQIAIDDPQAGRELLEALGFVEAVCFEKRRESWRLGACSIELDEVPYLGCFIEIEAPSGREVREAQERIGLGDETSLRTSYIALLVRHCEEHGLSADRIVFKS
jgi:adenylate cyclase class 2